MSKLDVFSNAMSLYVGWCYDGDVGAWVGQEAKKGLVKLTAERSAARRKRDEDGWNTFEYLTIEISAIEWATKNPDTATLAWEGYTFESKKSALDFLKAMRAALKVAKREYNTDVVWPDWAKTAEAAGWKPPKGWKP